MSKSKSELESSVKELRKQLAKAEARAERWKARAKAAEADLEAHLGTHDDEPGPLPPEQRFGLAVTETLKVLSTTLEDVVTSARNAFDELAGGTRAAVDESTETSAPPSPRPAWPPVTDDLSRDGDPTRVEPEPDDD